MVKKIDLKQNTKVKQKQNVNVKVHIDQRNTKKKPQKKRNNRPSAKREGVSSFSTGFTPVYIQSGNPYPIPSNPDATPIKASVEQQNVPSLVNPPTTSTTKINQEAQTTNNGFTAPKKRPKLTIHSVASRSISPLSFEDLGSVNISNRTPSLSESIGGRLYGKGIMHHYTPSINDTRDIRPISIRQPSINDDNNSEIFSRDVRPITIRQPRRTRNEMNEAERMGDNDTLNSKKGKK